MSSQKKAYLSTAPVGNTVGWFIKNDGSDITIVNPTLENVEVFNYFIPLEIMPENIIVPSSAFFAYAGNLDDIMFDRDKSYADSWTSIVNIMGSTSPYHAFWNYSSVYTRVQHYLNISVEPSESLSKKINSFFEGYEHVNDDKGNI